MRSLHDTRVLLLSSLLLLGAATASSDEILDVRARDDELVVPPQSSTFVIRCENLLDNDGAQCPAAMADVRVVRPPYHGVLSRSGHVWTFELGELFHRLGSDSFTYSLRAAGDGADTLTYATAVLLAGRYAVVEPPVVESFEGELDPAFTWTGDVEVLADAAIAGFKGLRATATPVLDAVGRHTLGAPPHGDGVLAGDDRLKIRPPGGSGPTQPVDPFAVYSLFRSDQADPTSRVVLRRSASGWEIRAELYASISHATTWTPIGSGVHLVEVDWWDGLPETAVPPRSGGLLLTVDHVVVGSIADVGEWDAGGEREVGVAVDPATTEAVTMDLDDVAFGTEPRAELTPAFVTTLNDDFDDGLSRWDTGGGFVNGTLVLSGGKGLEIRPLPGLDSYLLDTTPEAAAAYYLRFHLDRGSLDLPDGRALTMMSACGVDEVSLPDDQVRVQLSTLDGLRLTVSVRESGGMTALPSLAIPAAGATVELAWHAADSAVTNGLLSVWLDGELRREVRTLDNAGRSVESLRLGAFGVAEGTLGSFYVDRFESWTSPAP